MELKAFWRTLLFVAVSLLAAGSSLAQEPTSECAVVPNKEAPAYKIGRLLRSPNETPALIFYVTVSPASFDRASMRALGRQLNQQFCKDRSIEATIVDDERAASTWDPVHLPEFLAGATRGVYFLDRDSGEEHLAFSNARGRGFDEFLTLGPTPEQPTPRTYRNAYRNPNYNFSVLVPTSLVGTSTVPKEREGGISIPLPAGRHRYIWVGATENTFHFSSLSSASMFERLWIEADGARIVSFTRDPHYPLGNFNGTRLIVRYRLPGSATVLVKDLVLALKEKKGETGTLYRAEMGSTEQEYSRDKKIFERLVRSWRS